MTKPKTTQTGISLSLLFFLIGVPITIAGGVFLLKSAKHPVTSSDRSVKEGVTLHENTPESAQGRLSFARMEDTLTSIEVQRTLVAPPDADEPMILQSWSNGNPKVQAREWSDRGAAIEEHCFFTANKEPIGCGVMRDGQRWEGVFAQWSAPPGKLDTEATVLRELVSYREGLKDGLARSYRTDGTPMLETLFSEGRQISKRVFRKTENELVELGTQRLTGIPVSRRTRNTQD